MIKKLLVTVSLCALASCASSGTKVTPDQTSQFQKGVSTETEVIGQLGEPNDTTTMPDGQKVDKYVYARATANGASYVPIVGLFAGGVNTKTNTATFFFNAQGVMTGLSFSEGHNEVATGLANQK